MKAKHWTQVFSSGNSVLGPWASWAGHHLQGCLCELCLPPEHPGFPHHGKTKLRGERNLNNRGKENKVISGQFSSVQSLSHVWLFATPRTTAHQASLSITHSWSLLKLMSIESGMPPSHLILCRPLLLLLAKPFFARPAVLDGVVSSPLVHVLSPYPAVHRYAFSGLRLWAVPCTSLSGSLPSPESVCLATWLARCVPRGDTRVVFPPCCQGSLAHLHHLCWDPCPLWATFPIFVYKRRAASDLQMLCRKDMREGTGWERAGLALWEGALFVFGAPGGYSAVFSPDPHTDKQADHLWRVLGSVPSLPRSLCPPLSLSFMLCNYVSLFMWV